MKKYLVLLVILGFSNLLFSQVDLETVWKKNVFPTEINFAKFSGDGNFIYCAIGNTIQKMDAKTGEFVSIFDNVDTLPYAIISKMKISKLGNYIVAGYAGAAVIYDTRTEKKIKHIQLGVSSVAITQDEKYLIIGSLRPEYNGVVKYNVEKDQIEKVFTFNPFGIDQIAISNDGKYFATGTYYQDQTLNRFWHDQLILWDTETMTPIDTMEDIETGASSNGYYEIQFSLDDRLIGSLTNQNRNVHLFNLQDNKLIYTSNKSTMTFDFLPDTSHLALSYDHLEIINLNDFKNAGLYNSYSYGITSTTKNKSIFMYGGDTIYLFKQKLTFVKQSDKVPLNIRIFTENNQVSLFLGENTIGEINVSITDLLGINIYNETISNYQLNSKITLKAQLRPGFYICKVVADKREYSQKFEIVR